MIRDPLRNFTDLISRLSVAEKKLADGYNEIVEAIREGMKTEPSKFPEFFQAYSQWIEREGT